ncbi:MAG: hypothetical protein M3Y56_09205, partial [Armatimonadota bacterium]|nr:hypothetical protein [Armatimonadota bacterium]
AAHRPEMAMDGDANTYFKSAYGMGDGDDFIVLLSQPILAQSVHIVTGDGDNQDALTNGFVDASPDGTHFTKAASFDAAGVAEAPLNNVPLQALRIRVNPRQSIPSLLIREIAINGPVKIAHVEWGPWRGFADLSQAPDLAAWNQKAEQQMEDFYPDTAALLYSDKFIPPNMVNVVYRTGPGVTGVAATGGGVMTVNSKWCRDHPEDTGLTVHEMTHVIQAYSSYDPVWLVEGIADYIRWVRFEPENQHAGINTRSATYHDSYRTSATFLGWLELHYDSRLVTKLNQDVRFGTYKADLWQKYTGKNVDALWAEFITAYKADPAHIIIPQVAPADRLRILPTVAAGASQPVDLSAAFNAIGFTRDGATFGLNDGFDAGGAAYSATLLGPNPIWKNVQFKLGPAGAANTVTCNGQVIPVPAGPFGSLWIMGSAVQGNQMAQTFTVTYADGSTEQLAQNFSDWFGPRNFPGESRAFKMVYRNMGDGTRDARTFYDYAYGFNLNAAKTIKSITLPVNPYVKILAISLAR